MSNCRLHAFRILAKTFAESQFRYCPLTWIHYSRTFNNKSNRLRGRALRTVYSDCLLCLVMI